MITQKVRKFPGRIGRLLVLLPVLMVSPSCASDRIAQFEDTTLLIKGACRIRFGHANINWWLLQGQMTNIDVTPEGTTQLSSATFRVFDDSNHNGTYETGEPVKNFASVPTTAGLTFSGVSLSAGDVAGWDTNNVSWQIEVTDSANHVYTTSQHI
jgi:hypothetical protein